MVSLFAGAAKAPLSTLILIAEMTGGYQLLVPAMVSVFLSYFLSGDRGIFPSQVPSRTDSPAHIEEWGILSLERERVKDHMKKPITVSPDTPSGEILKLMSEHLIGGLPVVEDGRVVGIVTKSDLMGIERSLRDRKKARDLMTPDPITVTPEQTLADCLRLMIGAGVGRLPVVEDEETKKLTGIITRADVGKAIRRSRF
jgi:CIC family chloride channel protein